MKTIWLNSPLANRVGQMSSVRRKPKGIPFSGRGREKNKKYTWLYPTGHRERAFVLCKEGSSPIWMSQKLKRNSLVHLSIVYKVQLSLSINLGTLREKSLSLSKCEV